MNEIQNIDGAKGGFLSLNHPPTPLSQKIKYSTVQKSASMKYSINPTQIANSSDRLIQIKVTATTSILVVSFYLTNFILRMQSRNIHISSMRLSIVSQNMMS